MDQEKIGRFIAELRKAHSLTQKQLADRIGVSDKTVSKWETGRGLPEISIMQSLCETMDISINELLSGERLDPAAYRQKAEENITVLMQRRGFKKFTIHILTSTIPFLASFLVFPLAAEKIILPLYIPIVLFWCILWTVGNGVAGFTYALVKKWGKWRLLSIAAFHVFLLYILITLFVIACIVFSVT